MIEPFIRALNQAGVQADDRELAEILWLSRFVSGPVTVTPPQISAIKPEQPPDSTPSPIPSPGFERQAERPILLPTADTTPVYSVSLTGAGSQLHAGRKVRVSGAAALPAALDIARALRPFSRRFPSRQRLVFDEAATVRNAAEGGPLTPIRRPALERWFEVALVVEDTPSMAVWQQTIAELQRLLAGHGAFRDVHRWRFRTTGATIQLLSRAGVTRNVQQLKDPGGRRLILVVSDCVSPGWRDGAMAAVVAQWGVSMPVAIMQMLPETLWRHTALGSYNVSLRAVLPGVPNEHLAVTRPWWDIEPLEGSVPVPVVMLEPKVVSAWAGMVMAAGVSFPGVLLGSSASPEAVETSPPAAEKPLEPQERVQLFRDLASRQAFQLAVYLTAVPLTLPVMRLVQRTMFLSPEYRQLHLAEVFLGGLLERVTPADVRCDPDKVEYDFYEGVWDILTKSIRWSEANKVLAAITHYIEDHTGKPFDFEALLLDSEGEEALPAFARPFARVGAEFLKRLGKPPRNGKDSGLQSDQRVLQMIEQLYENRLCGRPEEKILRLLGLFDGLATSKEIEVLRNEPIPGLTDLKDTEWDETLSHLRGLGLLDSADDREPNTLDAHPLVRAYFAERLKEPKLDELRKEGHRRLYEYYQAAKPYKPQTEQKMKPLFVAVKHGCKAGLHVETFRNVIMPRILQLDENGQRRHFFSANTLGLWGETLAAIEYLFKEPWVRLRDGFKDVEEACILSAAGVILRAKFRFKESVQATEEAEKIYWERKEWNEAAKELRRLNQTHVALGNLAVACKTGEESKNLADEGGSIYEKVTCRARWGEALHHTAKDRQALTEARKQFKDAEEISDNWTERPKNSLLLLAGFSEYEYCELLISLQEYDSARGRAEELLKHEDVRENREPLWRALSHLVLGKIHFSESRYNDAQGNLQEALEYLHIAGEGQHIQLGYLALARLSCAKKEIDKAKEYLSNVRRADSSSQLRLHMTDYHLVSACCELQLRNRVEAAKHLSEARRLIEQTDYYRRQQELSELQERLKTL